MSDIKPTIEQMIVGLYQTGMSITELQDRTGLSRRFVYETLKLAKVPMRPRGGPFFKGKRDTFERLDTTQLLAADTYELAAQLDVSVCTVRKYKKLRKEGNQ